MTKRIAAAVAAIAAAVAGPASAVVVASQSFEVPVQTASQITYGPDEASYNSTPGSPAAAVAGITFHGFSGVIVNGAEGVFVDAYDGSQAAFLQGYQGGGGGIDWAVSGLTVGKQYVLTFASAASLVVPVDPFTVSVFGGTPTAYAPGTAYTTSTIDFTATATGGTITFTGTADPGNVATALDALSIADVPEPASWALFVAGFGLIGASLRRRTAAAA